MRLNSLQRMLRACSMLFLLVPAGCVIPAESSCLRTLRRSSASPFGIGLTLLLIQRLVEPLHEQQIGDLLDGGERIRLDATTPEFVPELVDLAGIQGLTAVA